MSRAWPEPIEDRVDKWRAAVEVMHQVNPEASALIHAELQAQLLRAQSAVSDIDRKAALVFPAVGVAASVVGANVQTATLADLRMSVLFGFVFVGFAVAVLCAMACLAPVWARSNGCLPKDLVLGAACDPVTTRIGIVSSLGFAVESTEQVIDSKAFWLAASFRSGAVGVFALVFFALVGGLRH